MLQSIKLLQWEKDYARNHSVTAVPVPYRLALLAASVARLPQEPPGPGCPQGMKKTLLAAPILHKNGRHIVQTSAILDAQKHHLHRLQMSLA